MLFHELVLLHQQHGRKQQARLLGDLDFVELGCCRAGRQCQRTEQERFRPKPAKHGSTSSPHVEHVTPEGYLADNLVPKARTRAGSSGPARFPAEPVHDRPAHDEFEIDGG